MDRVALQVAEGARRRRRERRRVQEQQAAVLDERIHARDQVGPATLREAPPPGVLMTAVRPAAGLCEELPAAVHVDDVRPGDQHRHRQAAARVDDAADVPAAAVQHGAVARECV